MTLTLKGFGRHVGVLKEFFFFVSLRSCLTSIEFQVLEENVCSSPRDRVRAVKLNREYMKRERERERKKTDSSVINDKFISIFGN